MRVPPTWQNGLDALRLTTTGASLLNDPLLQAIEVVEDPALLAYGSSPSANRIFVGCHGLSATQQACILAHEMTHCHDLASSGLEKDAYLAENGLARTELNAHMNQGLVLRELNRNPAYQGEINLFINGHTVWAKSARWLTRDDVKNDLTSNPQYASAMHRHTQEGKALFEYEPFLFSRRRAFHCDANLYVNMNWQKLRGSVLGRKSVFHPRVR